MCTPTHPRGGWRRAKAHRIVRDEVSFAANIVGVGCRLDLGRCERPIPEAEVTHLALEQRIIGVVALADVGIRTGHIVWNKSLARAVGDLCAVHIERSHTRAGNRDTEVLPSIKLDRPGRDERLQRSVLPDL